MAPMNNFNKYRAPLKPYNRPSTPATPPGRSGKCLANQLYASNAQYAIRPGQILPGLWRVVQNGVDHEPLSALQEPSLQPRCLE